MLTVKQVADRLSVSPSKVRQLIDAGQLVAVDIGLGRNKLYRISEESLAAMCRSKSSQPMARKRSRVEVEQFV
jgi:excisionase family DNA binding protein